jgi:hypothetical protein
LGFRRGRNPYRTGAAEVAMSDFAARWRGRGDTLVVRTG